MSGRGRQTLRCDRGWRFHSGDIDPPLSNTHLAGYMANKAGYARGAARPGYDDSDWRVVDLPHDWAIEGPKDAANHISSGYLPRGVGWYRRHFRLDPADRGRHLALRFDGVATHCTVWVNGHLLHRNFCGYTPFTVDISDVARFDGELNVVAVRVDATYMEGWWYEGAGIYRHVWLVSAPAVHVEADSLFVRPQRRGDDEWDTCVELEIANATDSDWTGPVHLELRDPHNAVQAGWQEAASVPARTTQTVTAHLPIRSPRLWDLDCPSLYTLVARVGDDEQSVRFGYRTIRFTGDGGFFLNDRHVLLKGTCNHQDHAGVGVAVPDSLHRFRIRRLKELGVNAYRCAHHPPAPELLDACDELGMLVMDENRNFGSSPEHLAQLRAMVRRDRNRPSVILWSLCNEEPIQTTPVSASIARTMAAEVRRLDPSRPVTAAVSGGLLSDGNIGDVLDVMSINYQLDTYDAFHEKHPDRPVVAAETHCAYGTRGVYETDRDRMLLAGRDTEAAPWGATARRTWRHVVERPYLAGLFIWTGFDYHGEPTPFTWPSNSSHWGLLDLCGFEKDAAWLHRAWFTREPVIHILPHWNWPGREGQAIDVAVYTNCDEVELSLNGRSLGRQKVDPVEMVQWAVAYEPGRLTAVGFKDGRAVAETAIETTGPAVALGVEVHPTVAGDPVPADGEHVIPVTVFALDSAGRRVPTAGHAVTIDIDGPGRVIGNGNGDPNSLEPEHGCRRSLFNGLAQFLIQTETTAGRIRITASADGLQAGELQLMSIAAELPPAVAVEQPRWFISNWRVSPTTADRPDPNQTIAEQDMNTWERIDPAQTSRPARGASDGYVIYRATFTPPKSVQRDGGVVRLRVLGSAEAYLDGQLVASGDGELTITLPPAEGARTLSILAQASGGLSGAVEIIRDAAAAQTR